MNNTHREPANYANGFTFVMNSETNECLIVFTQNQPGYNPETNKFDLSDRVKVSDIVLPYGMAVELAEKILKVAHSGEKQPE